MNTAYSVAKSISQNNWHSLSWMERTALQNEMNDFTNTETRRDVDVDTHCSQKLRRELNINNV